MSDMQTALPKDIVAICCSCIHLSHKPPMIRTAEPDWYAAMRRPLTELNQLRLRFNCPILCCGDVFDKWNSPPELINFAMDYLPREMYCIPGNHDLPLHNYQDKNKSAYQTLVHAGCIKDIHPSQPALVDNLILHGFPYGYEIKPCSMPPKTFGLHIAVAHHYLWKGELGYKNAPKENHLGEIRLQLQGYDTAVFGDNHIPFNAPGISNTPSVMNCGSLMARSANEIPFRQSVGLIAPDGSITPYQLDNSKDKYLDILHATEQADQLLDMTAFLEELAKLGETGTNFIESMERFLSSNKIAKKVCKIIRNALEEK